MEKEKLKNEIKELKNIIIYLVISIFRDKKIEEREVLDLLAEAVIKNEYKKQKADKNEWSL
jgi:hypothetical protein|tara:strand:- start:1170 stop:1352 length:183 start_codon:yes stop_codon:yes gene_type:complete